MRSTHSPLLSCLYSFCLSLSLQFFGVIVSWLYITRVEDAISEYGHYMDGLLNSAAHEREAKRQGRVAKWFKCMPEIDWWNDKKAAPANTQLVKPLQSIRTLLQPLLKSAYELQVYYLITPLWRKKKKKVLFLGRWSFSATRLLRVWYSSVNIQCTNARVGNKNRFVCF